MTTAERGNGMMMKRCETTRGFRTAALLAAAVMVATLGARAGETVIEGGFEGGSFGGSWVHGAAMINGPQNPSWADHAVVLDMPYTGTWSALLGYKYTPVYKNRYGFMYQDVTIPADISSAVFTFRYRQQGFDGSGFDPFLATVRDQADNILATLVVASFNDMSSRFKDSGWVDITYDMSAFAGQTVRLDFRQYNTRDNMFETWVFVDDVSLIHRKYVDLAVDGDGDDIFGDPGTGSGGTSLSSGVAGETVSYLLDIENEGLDIDSYTVSASSPAGWNTVIRYGSIDYAAPWTTPAVSPGSTISAEVLITIPAGEPIGSYSTIIDAVSVSFGNRFDSVTLGTNVVLADYMPDLVIDGDGAGVVDPSGGGGSSSGSVFPGGTVDYTIELVNAGALPDGFTISFSAASGLSAVVIDGGTTHTAAFSTGAIDPGDSRTYTLRVTAAATTLGGDYQSYVYATSSGDPLGIDGVTATTAVLAPRLDLVINGSGDGVYDPTGSGLGGTSTLSGLRGTTVYFPVTVQNEGGIDDAFRFSWTRPSGGWSAVINNGTTDHALPWTSPVFAPGEERDYVLAISVPDNAAFDTWISILDAVSINDNRISESVTAVIMVNDKIGVDVLIDGNGDDEYGAMGTGLGGFSSTTADPGDTVSFAILIQNEGGGNVFDFEWTSPAGWTVLLDGQASPVTGGSEGTYTLQVIIPLTSPGGTFDIIFDGLKSNKRYYVDSVTGRIFVTPGRLVDAVIDGDGDDVIGTPGLGDGGISTRGTLAGQTAVFSIELQNQGPFDESYTVSWSGPAGWTETFDGAAQPCNTGVIPAGGNAVYLFEATVPAAEIPGDFDYIVDVVSDDDPLNTESVTARVTVYPPPTVDLVKAVDLAAARPGDIVTYTIVYSNPGVEDAVEIEIIDPVPPEVELVLDAYGAGSDIAWTRGGTTVYLTADSTDADEALFDAGTGILQVIFSRQAPYTLSAGETGSLEYQVRIR
jgi:uncharacterized repeat protein (TIGR01451 family)